MAYCVPWPWSLTHPMTNQDEKLALGNSEQHSGPDRKIGVTEW